MSELEIDDTMTNDDDFEDELIDALEDEDLEDQDSHPEQGIPPKELVNHQTTFPTKDQTYRHLYGGAYKTTQRLTKYEKARIIGERATQIAHGGPTLVDIGDLKDPRDIARKELLEGKLPILIKRPLPTKNVRNPQYEIRRVRDLIISE